MAENVRAVLWLCLGTNLVCLGLNVATIVTFWAERDMRPVVIISLLAGIWCAFWAMWIGLRLAY